LNVYENTSGIDLIIDGHSHTVMTSGEGGEPIQSTGTKFEYIGVIVISPEGEIDDHYLVSTEDLGSDDGIMSLVHDIDDKVEAAYGNVIGYCETQIDGERETNRTAETNNGDLTADSMIWFAENNLELSEYELSHLLVLFGGGGLRAGLPVGDVTRKNIYEIHPFGNTVCLVKVSGEELLELMEASTAFVPDLCGGYPQSANIVFTVDCTKEYASGDAYPNSTYHQPYEIRRVTIESVCGQPFDPEAEYTIVTSDFGALGGDTYYLLSTKQRYDTGILLDDMLEQYITQALGGVISEERYGTPRGDHKMITEAAESDSQPAELAAESDAPDQDVTVYTVVAGDCLWTIAGEFYGDGLRWTDIYAANIDIIADPSLIYPGQGLVVPAA
nr:5'-nucleotidase C-terminal domain-containing protein [Clostridiales bacterium]